MTNIALPDIIFASVGCVTSTKGALDTFYNLSLAPNMRSNIAFISVVGTNLAQNQN